MSTFHVFLGGISHDIFHIFFLGKKISKSNIEQIKFSMMTKKRRWRKQSNKGPLLILSKKRYSLHVDICCNGFNKNKFFLCDEIIWL